MTEDILVSVKGLHMMEQDGENQEIEVISVGKYYFKNGKHYILYEEQEENGSDVVKNRITVKDGCIEVCKKGTVNSKMVFQENQRNESWYNTPFGNLMAGTTVTDMRVAEQDDRIDIRVSYGLEVNYEHVADCSIDIRVMAKESAQLGLQP